MTNREKAIADLTEWLKSLNNERLAYVVSSNTYIANFTCKHCVYDTGNVRNCRIKDTCHNGIKKWLEQQQS